jgi:hypothetical protein
VWEWIATWEAFVSEVDVPDLTGQSYRATPAGTYRSPSRSGTAPALVGRWSPTPSPASPSSPPWDGLTVDAVTIVGVGRGAALGRRPAREDREGPFGERGERVYHRYRAGTEDDQSYCIFCRFRPWQESGEPATGMVTVTRQGGNVIEQWSAAPDGSGGLVAVPPSRSQALRRRPGAGRPRRRPRPLGQHQRHRVDGAGGAQTRLIRNAAPAAWRSVRPAR